MIVPGSVNPLLIAGMPPVKFIGSSSAYNDTTNHVLPVPAGVNPGDLLVVSHVTNNALPSVPAGFTLAASWSGSSARIYVAYKIASGETSVTSTQSGSGSISALVAYSGLSPTAPFDAVSAVSKLTGTSCTTNTTTVSSSGGLVVQVWGVTNASAITVDPALNLRQSPTGSGANRLVVGDETAVAAGLTISRTLSIATSGAMAAFAVAFKG